MNARIPNIIIQLKMQQFLKLSRTPICLKPSPPASTYMLSYNSLQQMQNQKQLVNWQHQSLLGELEKLSSQLHQCNARQAASKQQHLQQILLLRIELEHQMEITARYDAEMKKCDNSKKELEKYYESKLELIKREIVQAFQNEIQQQKIRMGQELAKIRQNYSTKIGIIAEQSKDRENQLGMKDDRVQIFQVKLSIAESKLGEKDRLIEQLLQKVNNLQQHSHELLEKVKFSTLKVEASVEQSSKNMQYYKLKIQQSQLIKQQLQKRLQSISKQIQNKVKERQQLMKANEKLKQQLEGALRKFNKAQKQLDELNRKTFKNKDDYDKNAAQGRVFESGRETERDRERERSRDREKQRQKERQKERQKQRQKERQRQHQRQIQRENDRKIIQKLREQRDQLLDTISNLQKANERPIEMVENFSQQAQRLKVKYSQLQNQLIAIREENKNLRETFLSKQQKIKRLQELLTQNESQFQKKMDQFTKKSEQMEQRYKLQQGELKNLQKIIQTKYLRQLQQNKRKIDELQLTLDATQQVMEKDAKAKRDLVLELEQLKKAKKK